MMLTVSIRVTFDIVADALVASRVSRGLPDFKVIVGVQLVANSDATLQQSQFVG